MTGAVFVVDTCVVVSGTIGANPESPPARTLDAMLDGRLSYLMSGTLFDEYSRVLCRPGIMRRHGRTAGEIDEMLRVLAANATWCQPASVASAPDAGDDHLWALLASQPDSRLVTGDRRLLEQPPQPGVVLTPRQAVRMIG